MPERFDEPPCTEMHLRFWCKARSLSLLPSAPCIPLPLSAMSDLDEVMENSWVPVVSKLPLANSGIRSRTEDRMDLRVQDEIELARQGGAKRKRCVLSRPHFFKSLSIYLTLRSKERRNSGRSKDFARTSTPRYYDSRFAGRKNSHT